MRDPIDVCRILQTLLLADGKVVRTANQSGLIRPNLVTKPTAFTLRQLQHILASLTERFVAEDLFHINFVKHNAFVCVSAELS